MQAARQVEAGMQRAGEHVDPGLGDDAAGIGNADDQRPAPCVPRPRASVPADGGRRDSPGRRIWPMHQSGRHCKTPSAVFAAS